MGAPIVRVYRDAGAWAVMDGNEPPLRHDDLDDVPEDIRPHLAVLMVSPDGFYSPVIGRRISADVFWVRRVNSDDG